MANLSIRIADMEYFKELGSKLGELLNQIEVADFKDENGMNLKNNEAYIAMCGHIARGVEPEKTVHPSNYGNTDILEEFGVYVKRP